MIADYAAGWREGDVKRLGSKVFATQTGQVIWVSADPKSGAEKVKSMTFGEVLERGSRPRPEYGLRYEIQSLDVIDNQLAVVRVEQSRNGGSYVDVLILYRVGGEWKIVTKSFVSRPWG